MAGTMGRVNWNFSKAKKLIDLDLLTETEFWLVIYNFVLKVC